MREAQQGKAPNGSRAAEAASWILRELPGLGWVAAGLWERRWTGLAVWAAVTAAATCWICAQPGVYQAEALVLVESHRVPPQWLPASVEADLAGRLTRARQKVLASSELEAVIRNLNLYPDRAGRRATTESVVAEMRQSLRILSVDPASRDGLGPFRVVFQARDPHTAARTANHVAARFIEEASHARRLNAGAAARFLGTQVVSAREELEQREDTVRQYRLQYSDELPEQAEPLRAAARRLRQEMDSLRGEGLQLEREKGALEQALRPASPGAAEVANGDGERPAGPASPQTEELRKRLAALLAVYKPDYPDVRRLRAELARAESLDAEGAARTASEPHQDGSPPARTVETEAARKARERLGQIQERLEALEAKRTQLAAELGVTEERLQRVPLRQQELGTLTREHTLFSEQFLSLAARHQSAEMAAALERSYPSERLTILDDARPPEQPLGPRREWMLAMATLGGLLIGCLAAFARSLAPAWGRAEPAAAAQSEAENASYITA